MKTELRKAYEKMFGEVEGDLKLYDSDGNCIYHVSPNGDWLLSKFNSNGCVIYEKNSEYSTGFWAKRIYDADGNLIYEKNSERGIILDCRS